MNLRVIVVIAVLAVVIFVSGWFLGSAVSGCKCGEGGCRCQEQTTIIQ